MSSNFFRRNFSQMLILMCASVFWNCDEKTYNEIKKDYLSKIESSSTSILEEKFDDNSLNWTLSSYADYFGATLNIENGKLYISGTKEQSMFVCASVATSIHDGINYSIEVTTIWFEGKDDNSYGIMWGMKDLDNYFYFIISAKGYYQIGIANNRKYYERTSWTRSYVINKKSSNVLKIERVNSNVRYYINDKLVKDLPYEGIFGNKIGLRTDDKVLIAFDNLSIREYIFK